jgi:hypothetical protein
MQVEQTVGLLQRFTKEVFIHAFGQLTYLPTLSHNNCI